MSKLKKALALGYNRQKDAAPRAVAKGQGAVAERIISLAREHGVPIREDENLCEMLSKLELGEEIPTNMYKAVAEVFSYIYKASQRVQGASTGGDTRAGQKGQQ